MWDWRERTLTRRRLKQPIRNRRENAGQIRDNRCRALDGAHRIATPYEQDNKGFGREQWRFTNSSEKWRPSVTLSATKLKLKPKPKSSTDRRREGDCSWRFSARHTRPKIQRRKANANLSTRLHWSLQSANTFHFIFNSKV